MGKTKDDLSDILGGDKQPKGKKAVQAAAVAASKAKHAAAPSGKAKPAPSNKAKPAPSNKGKVNDKPAKKVASDKASKGEGKYYFPADGKDFISLKDKVAKVKKPASSKELAEALKTDTWRVRLVAVALEKEKRVKIDRSNKLYMIGPR